MYNFIIDHEVEHCLELGFAHGVGTAVMAAALDELGRGSVLSIDNTLAKDRQPSIDEVIGNLALEDRATWVFAERSYTWELMGMLEGQPTPRFDLCFVDGAHTWDTDGFAFFLVDRLLVPGGWLVFDDLDWTLASSASLKDTEWVHALPPAERETAQVRKVFELLVAPHPGYDEVYENDGWAYARKSRTRLEEPTVDAAKLDRSARVAAANPEAMRLRDERDLARSQYERLRSRKVVRAGLAAARLARPAVAASRRMKRSTTDE
jgi:predicted O-methyltransferase YrrM